MLTVWKQTCFTEISSVNLSKDHETFIIFPPYRLLQRRFSGEGDYDITLKLRFSWSTTSFILQPWNMGIFLFFLLFSFVDCDLPKSKPHISNRMSDILYMFRERSLWGDSSVNLYHRSGRFNVTAWGILLRLMEYSTCIWTRFLKKNKAEFIYSRTGTVKLDRIEN